MTDLTEWIKERRRIHAKGSTGYWASDEKNWDEPYDTTLVYDVFHNGDTMDRDHVADASYDNAEVIVDAHTTLPALLTAVENVLELHVPETEYGPDYYSGNYPCVECNRSDQEGLHPTPWPCPTVEAIQQAVSSE